MARASMTGLDLTQPDQYAIYGVRVEREFEPMKRSHLFAAAEQETGRGGYRTRTQAVRAITKARAIRAGWLKG